MSIIIPTVLTEIDRKKQCQQDQCWNESGKAGTFVTQKWLSWTCVFCQTVEAKP